MEIIQIQTRKVIERLVKKHQKEVKKTKNVTTVHHYTHQSWTTPYTMDTDHVVA